MREVSIRELSNEGGSVIERVLQGELIVVTKSGHPVAELRPVRKVPLTADRLVARWRTVPVIDLGALRADIDELLSAQA